MKRLLPFVVCCLLVSAIHTNVQSQNKIGYISLQELIPNMPEYKEAETKLGEYGKALNQQLIEYRRSYEIADSVYKADSAKWNASVRELKKKDLNALALKAFNFQNEANQLLQNRENELIAPIQQKAVSTTQAVAKENGYAYVLSKELLISFPNSDDMLPLVAKKLGLKIETSTASPKPTGK